jgi:two-component system, NtrC family, nitrogen regulation response regulator GlnG
MKPVWIIDDDQSIRWVLQKALEREGLAHRLFDNADDALRSLKEHVSPGAILTDIRMPGMDGLAFMEAVKARHPRLPVIVMTAYSDLDSAVSAYQGGAFEYLPKPFDITQALSLIHRALDEDQKGEGSTSAPLVANGQALLGQAPAMQEVFRIIGRLANSQATVLITGETGTGKELVAHALHQHSPRRNKPFIALNTAAIPRDLLESELFGHERGAFTGAAASRRGRFEQADGGTLFLDEIGDMPADLQTRLLRVLAEGEFYRVGGHTPVRVDVRVIAATHQDLEARVQDNAFREDLFHRLNVIRIQLPALRERREDIAPLTRHFLAKSATSLGIETKQIADAAMQVLSQMRFPGNVRELENLCHRLTVMAPGQTIEIKDLAPDVSLLPDTKHADGTSWETALTALVQQRLNNGDNGIMTTLAADLERILIRTALAHTGGRRIEAAQALGCGRNTLTRKIQELGLE